MCASSHVGQQHQCYPRLQLLILQGIYVLWSQAAWVEMYEDALVNSNVSLAPAPGDVQGVDKNIEDAFYLIEYYDQIHSKGEEPKCMMPSKDKKQAAELEKCNAKEDPCSGSTLEGTYLSMKKAPWKWASDDKSSNVKDLPKYIPQAQCDEPFMVALQQQMKTLKYFNLKNTIAWQKVSKIDLTKVDKDYKDAINAVRDYYDYRRAQLEIKAVHDNELSLTNYQGNIQYWFVLQHQVLNEADTASYTPVALFPDVPAGFLQRLFVELDFSFSAEGLTKARAFSSWMYGKMCEPAKKKAVETIGAVLVANLPAIAIGGVIAGPVGAAISSLICTALGVLIGVIGEKIKKTLKAEIEERAVIAILMQLAFLELQMLRPDEIGEAAEVAKGTKKPNKDWKDWYKFDDETKQSKQNNVLKCGDQDCKEEEVCMRYGVFTCLQEHIGLLVNVGCTPRCVKAPIPDAGNKDSRSPCTDDIHCRSGICDRTAKDSWMGLCRYPETVVKDGKKEQTRQWYTQQDVQANMDTTIAVEEERRHALTEVPKQKVAGPLTINKKAKQEDDFEMKGSDDFEDLGVVVNDNSNDQSFHTHVENID